MGAYAGGRVATPHYDFIMMREFNQKYSPLCSANVPMSRFFFGDDVSQSARQIEVTVKLVVKCVTKKPFFPWKSTSGRSGS